ncbi:hypothetical protein D3C74_251450 [compost metagenome]
MIRAAFIICFLLLATACGSSSNDSENANAPLTQGENSVSSDQVEITQEQYDKISNGMTYEEVINIVGGEGEVITETGEKGSDMYGIGVMYQGKEGTGTANFVFIGDKLQSKSQFGLK